MKTIDEVMTSPVVTAHRDESLGEVRAAMLERHIGCVPVISRGGDLLGIVTTNDAMEQWDPDQMVATVMTSPVLSAAPSTTTVEAARLMLTNRVHHVVVVDDDSVVGVVSAFDLLGELAGEVEAAEEAAGPIGRTARVGDVVVIRGHRLGDRDRRGVVAEVLGEGGGPPYIVHWLDDPHEPPHDVLFFPGSDAEIEGAV